MHSLLFPATSSEAPSDHRNFLTQVHLLRQVSPQVTDERACSPNHDRSSAALPSAHKTCTAPVESEEAALAALVSPVADRRAPPAGTPSRCAPD